MHPAFLIFGGIILAVAQLCLGYLGIDYHFGTIWASVALVVAFIFRFTLPMTIGAFFGATDVLHWHWAIALLFVVPGLIFVIPGVLAALLSNLKATMKNSAS